jgi:hypothetical protein
VGTSSGVVLAYAKKSPLSKSETTLFTWVLGLPNVKSSMEMQAVIEEAVSMCAWIGGQHQKLSELPKRVHTIIGSMLREMPADRIKYGADQIIAMLRDVVVTSRKWIMLGSSGEISKFGMQPGVLNLHIVD